MLGPAGEPIRERRPGGRGARRLERRLGVVGDGVRPARRPSAARASRSGARGPRGRRPTHRCPRPGAGRCARAASPPSLRTRRSRTERRAPRPAPGTTRAASAGETSRRRSRCGRRRGCRARARAGGRRSPRSPPANTVRCAMPASAPLERGDAVQALALDVAADAHRADRLQQRLRYRRLAAAREPAGDDQRRPRRLRVAPREPQVAARLGERRVLRRARAELRRPQPRDLGADERAVREIERQHGEPRVVAGALEIRVEKAVREIGAAAVLRGPSR